MDYYNAENSCVSRVFNCFVCVTLMLLLGLNIYAYLRVHPLSDSLDGDFSDIKYVVVQLTRGLNEVNRKHERLQSEMERISATLPVMSASASRAKDALDPSLRAQAIEMHDYDHKLSDYALESAGGRVVDTGDTVEHALVESPVGWALHALSSLMCRSCHSARAILKPGSLPGECWAFRGPRGEATIRLLGAVQVNAISMEHISPHISPTREISSAPRIFQVQGLQSRTDPYPHDFGTFEYDKDGKPIQYFEVINPSGNAYHLIRLRVMSNWGHTVYTCVYRFRVHGDLAPGQGPPRAAEGDVPAHIDRG